MVRVGNTDVTYFSQQKYSCLFYVNLELVVCWSIKCDRAGKSAVDEATFVIHRAPVCLSSISIIMASNLLCLDET